MENKKAQPEYFKATWEGMLNVLWGFVFDLYDKISDFYKKQFKLALFILEGKTFITAYDMTNMQELGRLIINKVLDDKNYLKYLQEEYSNRLNKLKQLFKQIDNVQRDKLSTNELINLYFTLIYKANDIIPPSFAEPVGLVLGDYINEELKKELNDKQKIMEYLNILLTTYHKSFLGEENLSLLRIYKRIKGRGLVIDSNILKNDSEIYSLLKKHQQEYYWMKNNYLAAHNLGINYFIKRLKDFTQEDLKNLDHDKERDVKVKKYKILNLFNNEKLNLLSKIADEFTYVHDNRKKWLQIYQAYLWILLNEFARRNGLTTEEIGWFTPEEIKENKLGDKEIIEERRKIIALVYDNGKTNMFTGRLAEKWKQKLSSGDSQDIKTLRGMTACPGKVRGKIRILLEAQDIDVLEEGEILVASNTTPEYLPAMKKAQAFLTEKGGITSHAAIASRELNKPCIVGINDIIKILKDGDEVEVDAEKGLVRLLRRAARSALKKQNERIVKILKKV